MATMKKAAMKAMKRRSMKKAAHAEEAAPKKGMKKGDEGKEVDGHARTLSPGYHSPAIFFLFLMFELALLKGSQFVKFFARWIGSVGFCNARVLVWCSRNWLSRGLCGDLLVRPSPQCGVGVRDPTPTPHFWAGVWANVGGGGPHPHPTLL